MNITNNNMFKETCEDLDLMLSFAEKTGIFPEGITDYSLTRNTLSYTVDKCGVKEENDELRERVNITLSKNIDRVRVKKDIRYHHHFVIVEENPNCQNYCTTCHQIITEFLVRGGKLEVTTASVTQEINENTLFDGARTIVEFYSIADFYKTQKLDSLPPSHSIKIETVDYSIPEDYHITDGVGPIDNNSKVIEKTI